MDLGIAGRKAIVCASSRGLGRACALALAEAGCDIIINGRDDAALAETGAAIKAVGGQAAIVKAAEGLVREGFLLADDVADVTSVALRGFDKISRHQRSDPSCDYSVPDA